MTVSLVTRSLLVISFIAAGLSGCKAHAPGPAVSEASDFGSRGERDLCCAFASEKSIFYQTANGCSSDPRGCCEGTWRSINAWGAEYRYAYPFSCDAMPPEALSDVEVCRGSTRFGEAAPVVGGASDTVTQLSRLAHVWIRTPAKEAGMGPKAAEPPPEYANAREAAFGRLADFFTAKAIRKKVRVAWVDHSGYGNLPKAQCQKLYMCDQKCVENAIEIGKDLGVYTVLNQCHAAAVQALRQCGCYNHCVAFFPGTSKCMKRVFPELRGLNLSDDGTQPLIAFP